MIEFLHLIIDEINVIPIEQVEKMQLNLTDKPEYRLTSILIIVVLMFVLTDIMETLKLLPVFRETQHVQNDLDQVQIIELLEIWY